MTNLEDVDMLGPVPGQRPGRAVPHKIRGHLHHRDGSQAPKMSFNKLWTEKSKEDWKGTTKVQVHTVLFRHLDLPLLLR